MRAILATGMSLAVMGAVFGQAGHTSAAETGDQGALRAPQLADRLDRPGLADVKILPGSVVVGAKDSQGHPVMMVITSPADVFELISRGAEDVNSARETTGSGTGGAQPRMAPRLCNLLPLAGDDCLEPETN
jgi:hypothetical protein